MKKNESSREELTGSEGTFTTRVKTLETEQSVRYSSFHQRRVLELLSSPAIHHSPFTEKEKEKQPLSVRVKGERGDGNAHFNLVLWEKQRR